MPSSGTSGSGAERMPLVTFTVKRSNKYRTLQELHEAALLPRLLSLRAEATSPATQSLGPMGTRTRLVAILLAVRRVVGECSANHCVPGSCVGRVICCPGHGVNCPCCASAHHHSPHAHNPHGHNPHGHNPHAHTPKPGVWPSFATAAALSASPWATYYTTVYGTTPPAAAFPLHVSATWLLYDGALIKAKVSGLPMSSTCPDNELDRYTANDLYQPPLVSWIWQ